MDTARAFEILRSLADGVDPLTGELLPETSVCNQAEIVRAFYCILEQANATQKPQKLQPPNAGKPWTEAEVEHLKDEFHAGTKFAAIAKEHGRTRGSIEIKLAQLGLIGENYFVKKAMLGKK